MFGYILGFMFASFILTIFNFDAFIISGVLELFGKTITTTGYYFISAMFGVLAWILAYIKDRD